MTLQAARPHATRSGGLRAGAPAPAPRAAIGVGRSVYGGRGGVVGREAGCRGTRHASGAGGAAAARATRGGLGERDASGGGRAAHRIGQGATGARAAGSGAGSVAAGAADLIQTRIGGLAGPSRRRRRRRTAGHAAGPGRCRRSCARPCRLCWRPARSRWSKCCQRCWRLSPSPRPRRSRTHPRFLFRCPGWPLEPPAPPVAVGAAVVAARDGEVDTAVGRAARACPRQLRRPLRRRRHHCRRCRRRRPGLRRCLTYRSRCRCWCRRGRQPSAAGRADRTRRGAVRARRAGRSGLIDVSHGIAPHQPLEPWRAKQPSADELTPVTRRGGRTSAQLNARNATAGQNCRAQSHDRPARAHSHRLSAGPEHGPQAKR